MSILLCVERYLVLLTLFFLWIVPTAYAQTSALFGDWREPSSGSIIRIALCDDGICLQLVHVSPRAPSMFDIYNPDPSQRGRALCGLRVGSHFGLKDASNAAGGILYDPKSGGTYRGLIRVHGDQLILRGYLGTPLLGRNEMWQRVRDTVASCSSTTAP